MSPHDAGSLVTAISCRRPKLDVAVVRVAPAPAFEQAMRGSNLRKRSARRQMATRVHDAATKLAHIQCPSAWVHAGTRTTAGTNTAHEENAGAVVVFEVINVGLEPCPVSNINTRTRPRFA